MKKIIQTLLSKSMSLNYKLLNYFHFNIVNDNSFHPDIKKLDSKLPKNNFTIKLAK